MGDGIYPLQRRNGCCLLSQVCLFQDASINESRLTLRSGFGISAIEVSNTYAQTCVLTATSTSFSTVQCAEGKFTDFGFVQLPMTIGGKVLPTYTIFAPLYQLNWQSSDLSLFPSTPPPPTTTAPGSSSNPNPSSNSGSSPRSSSTGTLSIPNATGGAGGDDNGAGSSDSLSPGVKAGIGVGVAIGVIAILALLFFIFRGIRRRKLAAGAGDSEHGGKGPVPLSKASETEGQEVKELEGNSVPVELGAASSAQGERTAAAHHQPVFELEADSPIEPPSRWLGQLNK